ncbi:hypothetical protein BRADI_1g73619v3 [Brachypodium distachyon]|uniref:Uncharacterized protein n=1 Tax=Brachypodium distachyon TaxID=15368 RepID=A0A2K2DV06_BRADI|nr:hypothetical protein BRADI_1g73619v3 [Brachypodium distachyon]
MASSPRYSSPLWSNSMCSSSKPLSTSTATSPCEVQQNKLLRIHLPLRASQHPLAGASLCYDICHMDNTSSHCPYSSYQLPRNHRMWPILLPKKPTFSPHTSNHGETSYKSIEEIEAISRKLHHRPGGR